MPERKSRSKENIGELKLPPGVKLRHILEGHQDWVTSLAFDPQGCTLASGSYDGTVRLWAADSGKLLRTLKGHEDYVWSVAFDSAGCTLASGSADHVVRLWDPASSESLCTLKAHDDWVMSVAFNSVSRTLASGSHDKTIRIWELDSGKPLSTLRGHTKLVMSVVFDSTGRVLASGSVDNTVRLWEADSGKLLRTLQGHRKAVRSTAFDREGHTLVSGSDDCTVRIWDVASGKLLRILEGHTGPVVGLTFSPDGALLASKSDDYTVALWRCDTWEPVAVIPETTQPGTSLLALAFHPNEPLLATSGCDPEKPKRTDGNLIHLWELDLDFLLGKRKPPGAAPLSVSYAVAKVLLVGDTGVGKSGLAERLVSDRFVRQDSTHARRTHSLESKIVPDENGAKTHRETVLWDLAGQPAFRLVHQLSMDDAALACVLFDNRSETNPLEGAAYWAQVLTQARTNANLPKFLVASRVDVGGLPASRERIEEFAREHSFTGVFMTSAKEGIGCQELLKAIQDGIPWSDVPKVTTTETLAALRDFVARLSGTKKTKRTKGKARPIGSVMLSCSELHQLFQKDFERPVPPEEFLSHLQRLEATDTVDLLIFQSTGQSPRAEDMVLLDPTRVDAYASALLVAAKDEPDGPGHLAESRVREADFPLAEAERIPDRAAEKHVLWFVVEELLARDLALRETIRGTEYLVFPSQCTASLKFPGAAAFGIAFAFAGPVRSIYATLIAQLAHYEGFSKREFFQDAAVYHTGKGRCVVRLRDEGRGKGELEVLFDGNPPAAVRQGFLDFVGKHLEAKSTPNSVKRRHAYHCSNVKCGEQFDDRVVKANLTAGQADLLCPFCRKTTPLLDLLAPPSAAASDVSEQIDIDAKIGRQRMTAAYVIKAKEAEGKFDIFLSHNSKDKAAVEKIAKRLLSVGLRPWLDKWNLAGGDTVMDALEDAIKTIPCAALCFGPADKGKWHIMEIRAYVQRWAGKGARMIPVILPGAPDAPELPLFIQQTLWVDMRDWESQDSDSFYQLVCGVCGKPPGDAPLRKFTARHVAEWQKKK